MSDLNQSENGNEMIKNLFQNKNLTGFDIAKNDQIAVMVKRDSTDFSNGQIIFVILSRVIHHERGHQIICQLVDTALRPQIMINHFEDQKHENILENNQINKQLPSKQITTIIYNAFQILTNQYEDFVQYIFEEQKIRDSENEQIQINLSQEGSHSGSFNEAKKSKQVSNSPDQQLTNEQKKQNKDEEQDCQDCVIMDSNFPQLTKNQEDSVLKKINDLSKLNQSQFLKCQVLERMFLLFYEPAPIQQTPVSYYNKIILQFVYQRPEQIMRYFYCDQKSKNKKSNSCQKIRKLSQHLYNSSVVQLFVHIMELENQGNFFVQQKIQILKTIVDQVFKFEQNKKNNKDNQAEALEEVSTISDLSEEKIQNYALLLKSLYEKLQDRYEQQKFLPIFKYHLNDEKLLEKIINYFFFNFNYFDMSGLLALLIQILKMDQINFRIHKLASQNVNPFGHNNNFSFNNKNQESSITSYDLKLSKEILDQIQKVIKKLSQKYGQWQGSTMRMIQYYELIHNWLNVSIKQRQSFTKNVLFSSNFINECIFKMQSHPNSTILHNQIKNILVDFLPKINESIKIILSPECQLISFIEVYLEKSQSKQKNTRIKCFTNQLYHIGKSLISVWQQQKILSVIHKTEDDEQDQSQKRPSQEPHSPTSDGQNAARFQNLKKIIQQKQQFYEHLICGDPRKIGQYQEQQSSEIIMTSSFKNFCKPSFNNFTTQNNQPSVKTSSNRYGQDTDLGVKNSFENKKQTDDLKKDTTLKKNSFRNLKLGEEQSGSIFQSVISPLNANRSHTFNFDFDALPLDSDNSEDAESVEQDMPLRDSGSGNFNEQQIKLMSQNIQNLQIAPGKILGVDSNILYSYNSNLKQQNLLSIDNYRRQELSKSMDIPAEQEIQKVQSYLQVYSPRKSEEDILSLGLDSNQGSKLSDDNKGQKGDNLTSFIKQSEKVEEQSNKDQIQTIDSNFVKMYSSYLQYDIDKLCLEVEDM